MPRLNFECAEVRKLVNHAMAAPRHRLPFEGKEPGKPALLLVKDDGIYLMSSGIPALAGEKTANLVIYAEGFNPNKDRNVWEKSQDAAGGDDFVEHLDIDKALANMPAFGRMSISLSATKLSIVVPVAITREDIAQSIQGILKRAHGRYVFFAPRGKLSSHPDRDKIRDLHPKAVILNDLPLDKAVDVYVKEKKLVLTA